MNTASMNSTKKPIKPLEPTEKLGELNAIAAYFKVYHSEPVLMDDLTDDMRIQSLDAAQATFNMIIRDAFAVRRTVKANADAKKHINRFIRVLFAFRRDVIDASKKYDNLQTALYGKESGIKARMNANLKEITVAKANGDMDEATRLEAEYQVLYADYRAIHPEHHEYHRAVQACIGYRPAEITHISYISEDRKTVYYTTEGEGKPRHASIGTNDMGEYFVNGSPGRGGAQKVGMIYLWEFED